jgi:hypothetical protein
MCYRAAGTVKEVDLLVDARRRRPVHTPSEEVDQLRWRSPGKALRRLTYAADRDLLEEFLEAPRPTSVVVLARHCQRGQALGVEEGRRTAPPWIPAAAAMPARGGRADRCFRAGGGLFGRTSCAAGRAPAEVGRPSRACRSPDLPELSDAGYLAHPNAAAAVFRELAAKHLASYVLQPGRCDYPGAAERPRCDQGCGDGEGDFWAVGMDGSEVLFADYYRRPETDSRGFLAAAFRAVPLPGGGLLGGGLLDRGHLARSRST